jgi:hypothetical protein
MEKHAAVAQQHCRAQSHGTKDADVPTGAAMPPRRPPAPNARESNRYAFKQDYGKKVFHGLTNSMRQFVRIVKTVK